MAKPFDTEDLDLALDRTGDALARLSGASILLTGGTGFFGRWIVSALVHANRTRNLGVRLSILTRSADRFRRNVPELAEAEGISLIEGDIRSFAPVGPFTHVIHAATDTSQEADAQRLRLMDSIVEGTRNALKVAADTGAKDFLYVYSGAVYGAQGITERVPEDFTGGPDPLDLRATYSESKRMAEHLCAVAAAASGLRPRIARCFAFVGPGLPLDGHFAIGNFIADALVGKTINISGDGTPLRSYLYAGDLVAWLLRILLAGQPGQAYNVGSDQAVSIRDLAETVNDVLGNAGGVHIAQVERSDGYRNRYIPAIDKARSALGLEVWTPLESAIARTARWAKLE